MRLSKGTYIPETRMPNIRAAWVQHIGLRERQEDSLGVSERFDARTMAQKGLLAVVADGMGGLSLGSEASGCAVRHILGLHAALKGVGAEDIPYLLRDMVLQANARVIERAALSPVECGTTLAMVWVYRNSAFWVSVGDSHIYLYRNGRIYCLNEDHTYRNVLLRDAIRQGTSFLDIEKGPQTGALTAYIGMDGLEQLDRNIKPLELMPGDRFLLCTDGLYTGLSAGEMEAVLRIADCRRCCSALVDEVLKKKLPQQDNLTSVLVDIHRG